MNLKLTEIDDSNRRRDKEEYGDIAQLAESIANNGLIHPLIIVRDSNRLVVGGRRLAAIRLLGIEELVEGRDFIYKDSIPEHKFRQIELEENVQRKDMSWKEQVRMIAEIHQLKKNESVLKDVPWGQKETAYALGFASAASVRTAIQLTGALNDPHSKVHKATNAREALTMLVDDAADRAASELAKRTAAKGSQVIAPISKDSAAALTSAYTEDEGPKVEGALPQFVVPLSSLAYCMDAIEFAKQMPPACIDHIITDLPYAIEMSNLKQDGMGMDVAITAEEHGVEDNLKFCEDLIRESYRILKDDAFFIFFYDLDWHGHWKSIAEDAGFSVQRWPFYWVKTSNCQNGAPHTNFTKAVETAMVCRKGTPTLSRPQNTNYWIGSNADAKLNFKHPFAKPIELWDVLIQAVSVEGQVIWDPCAGEGSQTRAVLHANRVPLATEKDATHFVGLQETIKKFYKQKVKGHELLFT